MLYMFPWKRIKNPQINPCISATVFTKNAKTTSKERLCVNKCCWDSPTPTCKSTNSDPCLTPHTKLNSKYIKDLNARAKSI